MPFSFPKMLFRLLRCEPVVRLASESLLFSPNSDADPLLERWLPRSDGKRMRLSLLGVAGRLAADVDADGACEVPFVFGLTGVPGASGAAPAETPFVVGV